MSWLSKNYEKAALGGAVVVALALAFFGWSKYGNVENDMPPPLSGPPAGPSKVAVDGADRIAQAEASMKRDRILERGLVGERPVDLFTGIPLFVSSSNNEPVDLVKGEPVHDPIPNSWWLDNRIDPGYADSPQRDPDQDGFSNLAEYQAKTDPNDAKDFPPLIAKLKYVKDETVTWLLSPRYGSQGSFPFNYKDSKGRTNKASAGDMIAPGELFFKKDPLKERFKLLGSEEKTERNEAIKLDVKVTIVRIEDQRPNKKNTIYELPAPLPTDREKEHVHYDRSAVFSLEALGLEGKDFTVEENTKFSLPPDGAKKDYLLKTVLPESVEVEHTAADGKVTPYTIPKGSMPQASANAATEP